MRLGDAIGIAWKLSSDEKGVYRLGNYFPKATDYVPVRTQNLFIPGGEDAREVGYFIPRDLRKVGGGKKVHGVEAKDNLATMECIGAIIIDDDRVFRKIEKKTDKKKRTDIARSWLNEVAQDEREFLKVLSNLMR